MIVVSILGIAPCLANEYDANIHSEIENDCSLAEYRCIGPIGLDFRLEKVPREQQIHAFEQQVQCNPIIATLGHSQHGCFIGKHLLQRGYLYSEKAYEGLMLSCSLHANSK